MRFDLINQLLRQYSVTLSAKLMKLDSFEMQDYAKLMDVEQGYLFSVLPKWCRWMQSGKNIFILEKPNSVKSEIQSHFQKQSQGKLRNRFQKPNSMMRECRERVYLLQIIK